MITKKIYAKSTKGEWLSCYNNIEENLEFDKDYKKNYYYKLLTENNNTFYTSTNTYPTLYKDEKMTIKANILVGTIGTMGGLNSESQPEQDNVNHPSHYNSSINGIETFDAIIATMTPEQAIGGMKWNVSKYLSRAGKKGDALEDYKKAQWYMNKLVKFMEDNQC